MKSCLHCASGKGLIACGDDRGSLWLYNLPQFGKDGGKSIEGKVDPTTRYESEFCCNFRRELLVSCMSNDKSLLEQVVILEAGVSDRI